MSHLYIGTHDKVDRIVDAIDFSKPFLLISDSQAIADTITARIPAFTKVYSIDWNRDCFNPLTERQNFINVLPQLFPRTSTLTREDADYLWLNCLATLDPTATFYEILTTLSHRSAETRDSYLERNWNHISDWDPKRYDAAVGRVRMQIDTLIIDPVMRRILTRPISFRPDKVVIAVIDRGYWGEFNARALGLFLIGHHQGQIVLPNAAMYLRSFHSTLIEQQRLIAGINFLEELPLPLQHLVLTIPHKEGVGCIYDDALVLARFAGKLPATDGHDTFVKTAMGRL